MTEAEFRGVIGFNRDRLLRVLAMLLDLAGIAEGETVETLPRHLRGYVNRLLRPAESATRRLIVIAAQFLVVTVRHAVKRPVPERTGPRHPPVFAAPPESRPAPRPRTRQPRPAGDGLTVTIHAQLKARPKPKRTKPKTGNRERLPALPLLDALPDYDAPPPRFGVRGRPRVRALWPVPVYMRVPEPPEPSFPLPDDPVSAARLCRRLSVLRSVLDDIDGAARRTARWLARRRARGCLPGKRLHPLRPGRPPGHRKRSPHEVHDILSECNYFAWHACRSGQGP